MAKQRFMVGNGDYQELETYFVERRPESIFLVCGNSVSKLEIGRYFKELGERLGVRIVHFSDFQPNPLYESVVKGTDIFLRESCDMISAIGGGSAMDVAKCIKLYAGREEPEKYLHMEFLAVPTTAGTGSEATRFAVIYKDGEKQSVTDENCIPTAVYMDAMLLETLPVYQKKSAMMDALCHAVEAYWSVHSTEESRKDSEKAIRIILKNQRAYIDGEYAAGVEMLKAANLAGKAINIAQTTAGHAMCYKLTGLYGLAHGHAAALCVAKLWPHMLEHTSQCTDFRGIEYLNTVFRGLAEAMGAEDEKSAAGQFQELLDDLGLEAPVPEREEDFELLRKTVNSGRLKNHPVCLKEHDIDRLYHEILSEKQKEE